MSNLDQAWGSVSADSDTSFEKNPPPIGYVGCPQVIDIRVGTTKPEKGGDQYFAVDFVDGDYRWGIFKKFTKNGQPHEGSIKSAKITLRQLGLDVPSPAVLEHSLRTIIGRYYAVEQRAGDMNPRTGMPYVNTEITGPASAPTLNVAPAQPAPQVQPPPQQYVTQVGPNGMSQQVPVQNQPAQPVAHGVAPGQQTPEQQAQSAAVVSGQPQPGAQFGDQAPW